MHNYITHTYVQTNIICKLTHILKFTFIHIYKHVFIHTYKFKLEYLYKYLTQTYT